MIEQTETRANTQNGSELTALQKRIGARLKDLRVKKGFTSHETFALTHGLPKTQYWRMEKGNVNMTLKSLSTVLAIHDLTIEEFFSTLYQ